MSLFRRSEVRYASLTSPNGKKFKQSPRTKGKRQATKPHDKLKAKVWRVNKLGEIPDITSEEACIRRLEERAHKKLLDDDKSRIGFQLQHFAGMQLEDVTESKICLAVQRMTNRHREENWRLRVEACRKKEKPVPEYTPKPASVAMKATYLSFMKALLRAIEREWKMLDKAPAIKVPRPKNERIRWLEPHEVQRLIGEYSEPLKSAVEFALATGLRRSNTINPEWQQVDMRRRVAWIDSEEGKSNRTIDVALNDTVCRVLKKQIGNHHRWISVYKENCTRPDGTKAPAVRKMRYDTSTVWKVTLRRAGIGDFRFHNLRHTWVSWLVQAEVPLPVLREMGDWESVEMVRRYAHLAPNHLTEHTRQIDPILDPSVPNSSQLKNGEGTNDV